MRTTVEFPDELLEQARQEASQSGMSLRELLIEALENRLAEGRQRKPRKRPPMVKAAKGSPAMRLLTRGEIDEAMFG